MSIFPRDEYQPRRGVAMRIVEPNPNLRLGAPRDARIEGEAKKFENQEFILSKAMTDQAPKLSKVKTFNTWESGNGNVIAPPKPEPKVYARLIGHRVPEGMMSKFYHGDAVQRNRNAEQDRMQHARDFADNFSPQPPERMHKIVPHAIQPTPLPPINGFPGLGSVVREKPGGKASVSDGVYDPLGMRNWAPRVTGLKRLPVSNQASLSDGTLAHDDGVSFESIQKKRHPVPHRVTVEPTHGPDQDMQGFRGLGAVDHPAPTHGRRHSPRTFADRHALPMTGMPPQPHQHQQGAFHAESPQQHRQQHSGHYTHDHQPSQQHSQSQFRSSSSLGWAAPQQQQQQQHHQHASGRVSAPPGLGSSVRFHAQTN